MKKIFATLVCFALIIGIFAFTGCDKEIQEIIDEITSAIEETTSAEDSTTVEPDDVIVGKYVIFEFYTSYGGQCARARYCDAGAPYTKEDGGFEFKNDNTFTFKMKDNDNGYNVYSGTWRKEDGRYFCTISDESLVTATATLGENVEFEMFMEDENHVRFGKDEFDDPSVLYLGFIFEREDGAATPSDPEGTYKLYEVKTLENEKESRVRVTDPNSLDSADDMTVTFHSDGTAEYSFLALSGTGTWTSDGDRVYIHTGTPGDAPAILTFEDGEYSYQITDVSTFYIKKVA